jgi:hypothetical protein
MLRWKELAIRTEFLKYFPMPDKQDAEQGRRKLQVEVELPPLIGGGCGGVCYDDLLMTVSYQNSKEAKEALEFAMHTKFYLREPVRSALQQVISKLGIRSEKSYFNPHNWDLSQPIYLVALAFYHTRRTLRQPLVITDRDLFLPGYEPLGFIDGFATLPGYDPVWTGDVVQFDDLLLKPHRGWVQGNWAYALKRKIRRQTNPEIQEKMEAVLGLMAATKVFERPYTFFDPLINGDVNDEAEVGLRKISRLVVQNCQEMIDNIPTPVDNLSRYLVPLYLSKEEFNEKFRAYLTLSDTLEGVSHQAMLNEIIKGLI